MGQKTNIATGVGGYVGYKAGQAIGGYFRTGNLKDKMPSLLNEGFGPRIAVETMENWQKSGTKPQFDFAVEAQKLDDKHLYQAVYSQYGEQAADFLEGRINKARSKSVEIDFDQELASFLDENDIAYDSSNLVNSIVRKYRYDAEFQEIFDQKYGHLDPNGPSRAMLILANFALLPAALFTLFLYPILFVKQDNDLSALGPAVMIIVVPYWIVTLSGLKNGHNLANRLGWASKVCPIIVYLCLLMLFGVGLQNDFGLIVLSVVAGGLAIPGSIICTKRGVTSR